jgi:hypothetical protein
MSNCVTISLPAKTGLLRVKLPIRTFTHALSERFAINYLFLLLLLFALCFKNSTSHARCFQSFLQVVTRSTNCIILTKRRAWFIFFGFKTHYLGATKTPNDPSIPSQFIMSCHCLYIGLLLTQEVL